MKCLTLIRFAEEHDATPGVLLLDGAYQCLTLERSYQDNQTCKSCIPCGTYQMCKRYSQKLKALTYFVENVPNRTGIMFHAGNYVHETRGCILVGNQIKKSTTEVRLVNSRCAFQNLLQNIADKSAELTILEKDY